MENQGDTMKKITSFFNTLQERLFSSTYQVQRIVILTAIALGLVLISFSGYYYYDRYYTDQPKKQEVTLAEAEKAVRDNPDDPEIRLNLAEAYMLNSRFDDAIGQASQVMESYPDNKRAWLLIGVSNSLNDNPQDAIEPLQKYLDASKEDEMPGLNLSLQSAAYYLGDSYLQLGQPEKAVPVLEMNLEWSQTDADTMYKLGVAYTEIKEYNKALVVLHKATVFVPDFREAYEQMAVVFDTTNEPALAKYARGMVAYSDKDYDTAKRLLLESAQARPDSAPTFSGLGMTYEALNDFQNAKLSYETALQLDPNYFSASTGLSRMEVLLQK
jgi:tetratricopeptide (TPR) repeat protein